MKKMQLTAITAALGATMLSGCASVDKANKNIAETNNTSAKIFDSSKQKSTAAAQDSTRDSLANFGKVQKNWVNPVPLKKSELFAERTNLPQFFREEVGLTLPGKVSLIEIISELQRSTKNNFTISQDVYNSANGSGTIITATGGKAASAAPATSGKNDAISKTIGTGGAVPIYVNDFVFKGSLEQALDLMSSKANVGWKWNGNSIEVFRFETKSYNIAALSGATTTRANIDIQSDDSGGGGGSSNDKGASTKAGSGVSRTNDYNSWDEVRSYLMALLSSNGSMAVMESTGMITVKDSPSVHLQIAKAVKDLNSVIGKQVFMNIQVYAVSMNDEDNYGVNWNAVWQTAGSGLKLNLANAAQNISNASGITAGITKGPFSGSSVMLQALSSIGQASLVNEFSISTLNGQPTPIGNNRKIAYIESITKEKSGGDTASTSITVKPGAVYQGIGMNVTPRLQVGSDKLLLEYTLSLNDVEKLESFTTGEGENSATVQLPTTTIKNILQRASLRSGQTLVLSGFKQSTSQINNSGVGNANNPMLGGNKNGKNSSQYLVITVTPYVAQDNE